MNSRGIPGIQIMLPAFIAIRSMRLSAATAFSLRIPKALLKRTTGLRKSSLRLAKQHWITCTHMTQRCLHTAKRLYTSHQAKKVFLGMAANRYNPARRLPNVRFNWFALGTCFGLGLALLMHLVTAATQVTPIAQTLPSIPEIPKITAQVTPVVTPQALATAPAEPATSPLSTTQNASTATPLPAPSPQPLAIPTYPVTLALKVGKGDTLVDMLVANRVQTSEAHQIINALKSKFNPGQLKIGQKISVTLARHETLGDKAAVQELAIKLPNLSTIELQRLESGGFNVAATENASNQKTFRGKGKVRSSLFQAGAEAHIPANTMRELVKAFSYDIDFQREIHPGDTVEVLMDKKQIKKGTYSTAGGTLRYAALTLQGTKYEIFRFKDANGELAWFDGNGKSIKKSLLRTPVDAVHITSGFGLRTHPIMGYTKMHRGVDFGASTGTPIMAAGDGVVTFKGWSNSYGNFVTIKHNDKYETAYGHCSRFGNIAVGKRVKQGQVIAYVGMTGMATGPHLHYEVREAGNQVNPVAKQFNMAAGLGGKKLAAFKTAKQSALNELASLAKKSTTVASR